MKIDFKKIINIKNKEDLKDFELDKPIFTNNNYLFHYLIIGHNLDGLKLAKFPVYIENHDHLNAFDLAAKEYDMDILCYLIETYPEYIYNRNKKRDAFTAYLDFENFSILIERFPDLDWEELIINGMTNTGELLDHIIINLNYIELMKFLKVFKIRPTRLEPYLFNICKNQNLKINDKIKLLELYKEEELNIKESYGVGLILKAINLDDEGLFDYLLKKNVDVDYYTFINTNSPLKEGIVQDILKQKSFYTNKILKKGIDNINTTDKFLDNVLHMVFYARINRKNTNPSIIPNYEPDFEIIKLANSDTWNQINKDKMTPLMLVTYLDFDIYSPLIKKNNIQIRKDSLKILEQDDLKNGSQNKKWITFLHSLPEYNDMIEKVNIKDDTYSHSTLFRATFRDVSIQALYLIDTYKDLFLPNMTSYLLNNLTFANSMPFADSLIMKEPIFPWVICYYNSNEYYIHSYLNNIINAQRRKGDKRFAVVFLSIIYPTTLHANIIIYDFKSMTIERFEPYGNDMITGKEIDDILEEELTWNTGMKYVQPKDYLPIAGFQAISDELSNDNLKRGDYGGFCLAWCLWYLEARLQNQSVDPKTLVEKLIKKLTKSDNKFSEHIRNYANRIHEKQVKYMMEIGIDKKMISNENMDNESNNKIVNFIINKFSTSIDR